ncbi:hypothetical protein GTP45_12120 [Pseudoduganella sp. FT55W]|uniref:HTH luxR-type domain-containing protein n=1 Tax=Duganella rivi TaxID=2666083 RepID=A0A7X4GS13_9BURK|nr:LuxR C-terminal-related transcriptional regulator [Duganella rivi]MYM67574.1 hypothetical protein [Duganella rivi]
MDFVAQKLLPPSPAGTLMPRPDVLARLTRAGSHRMVLLCAPAGYGKTCVLQLLHAGFAASQVPVAWLTFDAADRDPARLLLALRAALLGGGAEADAPLRTLGSTPVRHLFLDDVEHLDGDAIRLLLSVIEEVLPPGVCVYLGSRSLHQVGVARLKARRILLELNLESLRFELGETENYLRQANLYLADEQMRWLHESTEGWPAAIELLALAWKRIQGSADQHLRDLHGVSDLNHYLAEEVLRSQPEGVQAFLLATAPLSSFCVALADAVRDSTDSGELITSIRLSGLPIQPIGEHWYRYHPLFAGHIMRCGAPGGNAQALVHARAAVWLKAHGRSLEAFDCHIKAAEFEAAAALLEELAETLRQRAQYPSLIRCCERLPEVLLHRHPRICRSLLVSLLYLQRRDEARRWIAYFREHATPSGADAFYGESLRAFEPVLAFLDADIDYCITLVERNWPLQQQADAYERGALATVAAYSYLVRGRLAETVQMLIQARRMCAENNSATMMSVVIFLQAYLDAMQGRHDAALEQMMGVDLLLQRHSADIPPVFLHSYSGGLLLMLLYERNSIGELEERIKIAREMEGIPMPWDMVSGILVTQAKLMALQSGAMAAKRWLEGEIMKARKHAPQLRLALESELSRLMVVSGDRDGIAGYAASLGDANHGLASWIGSSQEIDGGGIAQARLALAAGQLQTAKSQLRRLLEQSVQGGRHWRAAKLRVLLALAEERGGDRRAAQLLMALALEQGAQSGLVRTFLDEGEDVLCLLEALQDGPPGTLSHAAVAHLRTLLACADAARAADPPLLAELTVAERNLLELVAQGATNRAAALTLGVSVNTVKWHMAQIFGKLGAANRVQAVNLARQAGMLDS